MCFGSLGSTIMRPLRQLCRGVLCVVLLAAWGGLLQVLGEGGGVRSQGRQASSVFLRSKRANSFFIEEMLQGNLERECYEERCSYEEAREYFENTPRTDFFWTKYFDGDQCDPSPCLHGGSCTDRVGGYTCNCSWPFYGVNCEVNAERASKPPVEELIVPIQECPTSGPTACEQFCTMMYDTFTCSCSEGYFLHEDRRSCSPQVKHPCGRVSPSKPDGRDNNDVYNCPHGHCPWQVSLMDSRGEELCGGVVLGRRSVLSSAQCLFLRKGPPLKPSNLYIQAANQISAVHAFYIHSRYSQGRHDDDLVLLQLARPLALGHALFPLCLPTKDFSENVLMRPGRAGLTGRSPERQTYMTLSQCRAQPDVSHPITNKMFCMRRTALVNYNNTRPVRPERGRQSLHGLQAPLSVERVPEVRSGDNSAAGGTNVTATNTTNGVNNAPNVAVNNATNVAMNATESASQSERPAATTRDRLQLLPGTPMATEEQGTVFLTGLLLSAPAGEGAPPGGGSGGQEVPVFTKLSRYLVWIRQRLRLVEEADMTEQQYLFPDER